MTTAWVPLATTTLASNSASVTFSSIPSGYRDLILVMNYGAASAAFSGKAYVNSDTTSGNYTRVTMKGSGSAAASNTNGGSIRWEVQATANSNAILQFMDYSATDKHKTILLRANNAGNGTEAAVNRWANTAAINQIQVAFGTDLTAGSTLSLYGSNKL